MEQCDLSVIIPIYNGGRFLKATLDSILGQTYRNYELILVDDGSTDNTSVICDEYSKKDERIKVLHQKNGGMSNARDNGYKIALNNTSILFLDADDIFVENMFEDMMKHKDAEIVCICYKNVNTDKIMSYQFDVSVVKTEQMTGKELMPRYLEPGDSMGKVGNFVGMMFSREFYKKMDPIIRAAQNILPQNYLNDVYCGPRFLMNANRVVLLDGIYMAHRISKYTDSRLMKPNDLHYELALANKMNIEYYKSCNCDLAYDEHLIGFYLVILKLWYQAVTREKDDSKKRRCVEMIDDYYSEYYNELKELRCNSFNDKMIKVSIMLWKINKSLWRFTVGTLRYEFMYRLQV